MKTIWILNWVWFVATPIQVLSANTLYDYKFPGITSGSDLYWLNSEQVPNPYEATELALSDLCETLLYAADTIMENTSECVGKILGLLPDQDTRKQMRAALSSRHAWSQFLSNLALEPNAQLRDLIKLKILFYFQKEYIVITTSGDLTVIPKKDFRYTPVVEVKFDSDLINYYKDAFGQIYLYSDVEKTKTLLKTIPVYWKNPWTNLLDKIINRGRGFSDKGLYYYGQMLTSIEPIHLKYKFKAYEETSILGTQYSYTGGKQFIPDGETVATYLQRAKSFASDAIYFDLIYRLLVNIAQSDNRLWDVSNVGIIRFHCIKDSQLKTCEVDLHNSVSGFEEAYIHWIWINPRPTAINERLLFRQYPPYSKDMIKKAKGLSPN